MTKQGFFLGSNSGDGFSSLYEPFTKEYQRLYVLKGGAGSGKSSFMRRTLENIGNSGIDGGCVYCSGDPESLDGIYFPTLSTAVVDGTPPHAIEPECVGFSKYINLGAFTAGIPDGVSEKLRALKRENARVYSSAYRLLGSAKGISEELRTLCSDSVPHTEKRAEGIASRVFGKGTGSAGHTTERFLDAITYRGEIELSPPCSRIWSFDGDHGLSHPAMRVIAERARRAGYDVILCRDPLEPSLLKHIIVPALDIAFVTSHDGVADAERRIHLDAISGMTKEERAGMRSLRRLYSSVTELAVERLKEAKRIHDEMEREVNPYVDFAAVLSLADAVSEGLLTR